MFVVFKKFGWLSALTLRRRRRRGRVGGRPLVGRRGCVGGGWKKSTTEDHANYSDVTDFLGWHGEGVVREDGDVGKLARLDRALPLLLKSKACGIERDGAESVEGRDALVGAEAKARARETGSGVGHDGQGIGVGDWSVGVEREWDTEGFGSGQG